MLLQLERNRVLSRVTFVLTVGFGDFVSFDAGGHRASRFHDPADGRIDKLLEFGGIEMRDDLM
jgi:hypothetical protein